MQVTLCQNSFIPQKDNFGIGFRLCVESGFRLWIQVQSGADVGTEDIVGLTREKYRF